MVHEGSRDQTNKMVDPETVIERWLDLLEEQPFRLTETTFGQSNFADKDTGDYSTNSILSLEDNRGSARRVWSCKSLIVLLEKELPLNFEKKAYFVVNKGPTKTGKNRTFLQSAVISTVLRGVVKASKKKKTTTAAPSSSSLSTPKTHPAKKTAKRKQCVVEMEQEAGDDDDFIITSRQPPKKARRKQVAR